MTYYAIFNKDNVQVGDEALRNEFRAWLCLIEENDKPNFKVITIAECENRILAFKKIGYTCKPVLCVNPETHVVVDKNALRQIDSLDCGFMSSGEVCRLFEMATRRPYSGKETCINDMLRIVMLAMNIKLTQIETGDIEFIKKFLSAGKENT